MRIAAASASCLPSSFITANCFRSWFFAPPCRGPCSRALRCTAPTAGAQAAPLRHVKVLQHRLGASSS
ncbi:hypothetical protein PHYSODRAFT_288575 [Phytophthora sojae]|uniref:Uncharacterized protein n=1 Tax=Phytophthora sojae (strain P6497) TaxID=1094619 RepID=G5A5I5_PHYSP|nr:hypothetical protein PHYSODRAFT_288575 [Phytophthora sojae]EGZ08590.1 hypothetical protein PHYSODRAFT_288575 [Phytophthora sojae]|eukprot:XP_009535223.1 hypothetical protein PHYSODRAFT_288575 [Phytophthora sojae]